MKATGAQQGAPEPPAALRGRGAATQARQERTAHRGHRRARHLRLAHVEMALPEPPAELCPHRVTLATTPRPGAQSHLRVTTLQGPSFYGDCTGCVWGGWEGGDLNSFSLDNAHGESKG